MTSRIIIIIIIIQVGTSYQLKSEIIKSFELRAAGDERDGTRYFALSEFLFLKGRAQCDKTEM